MQGSRNAPFGSSISVRTSRVFGIEDGQPPAVRAVEPVVLVAAVVAEVGVEVARVVAAGMAFGEEDLAGRRPA